jgi:TolB protein
LNARTLASFATVFCVFGVAALAKAQERPAVQVTPGSSRVFRIAVQEFADRNAAPDPKRMAALRLDLEQALGFSGVMLPLTHDAFLGPERTEQLTTGKRYDCGDWSQAGADALVEGELGGDGTTVSIEFRVWDTARCQPMGKRGARRLEGPPSALPRLARRLADRVVEDFTGKRGAADTEIAFISTRSGHREVNVMYADGKNVRPTTRGPVLKSFPSWTPDGDGIVYTAHAQGGRPHLYLTARGKRKPGKLLARAFPDSSVFRGVFDPSGKSLAVVSSVSGIAQIFHVREDGRELRQLTNNHALDIGPAWSPDGERLAFVSDRSGSPQIYIMNPDGTGVRRLTFQGGYNTGPAWSPDGRWIAYETRLEGQFDIWLIDPTGEVNVPLVEHRRSDESPSWSPDSRKIAFSSTRRGQADIYVTDLRGRELWRLTEKAGDNIHPSWGPFPSP